MNRADTAGLLDTAFALAGLLHPDDICATVADMPSADVIREVRDILGAHCPEAGTDFGPHAGDAYLACTAELAIRDLLAALDECESDRLGVRLSHAATRTRDDGTRADLYELLDTLYHTEPRTDDTVCGCGEPGC